MLQQLLIIGFGGFMGAISRYLVYFGLSHFIKNNMLSWGTLTVNLLGSFLIGIILGLSLKYDFINKGTVLNILFVTGFLGAFTTFSTFSQDNLLLLIDRQYVLFVINILLNLVLGIALVAAGYFLILKTK
jgi:CrcB protein